MWLTPVSMALLQARARLEPEPVADERPSTVRLVPHRIACRRGGRKRPALFVHGITPHSVLRENVTRRLVAVGGCRLSFDVPEGFAEQVSGPDGPPRA